MSNVEGIPDIVVKILTSSSAEEAEIHAELAFGKKRADIISEWTPKVKLAFIQDRDFMLTAMERDCSCVRGVFSYFPEKYMALLAYSQADFSISEIEPHLSAISITISFWPHERTPELKAALQRKIKSQFPF